jgi:hypothetical protein
MDDSIKISKNFTVGNWKYLRSKLEIENEDYWDKAVEVFNDRINSRFLVPIQRIKKGDTKQGEGFAITLVSVVLLEFIAAFELGKIYELDKNSLTPTSYNSSANLFSVFFESVDLFRTGFQSKTLQKRFYSHIRSGLVHEARTKGSDVIISSRSSKNTNPQLFYFKENQESRLNRDLLLEKITNHISNYCNMILLPENVKKRKGFIMKMDELAGLKHVWYFIYGSNLLDSRLDERLKVLNSFSLAKERVILEDYKFIYNKKSKDGSAKANLISKEGSKTEGIAICLLEDTLFEFGEKFEIGYDLKSVDVSYFDEQANKKTFAAKTFISNNLTDSRPTEEYVGLIISGAHENSLPDEYITEILTL